MGSESDPNNFIKPVIYGSVSHQTADIYEAAANLAGASFKRVTNEEVPEHEKQYKAGEGFVTVEVDFLGMRLEFWKKVHELSPPPPPKPVKASPELVTSSKV